MATFKITIAYDGTRYQGWQRLGNTDNTIQGKIEGVLSRYFQQTIQIHGSGRTDAGVHAKAQVASAVLPVEAISPADLASMNHYLPEDIQLLDMEKADARFHARYHAKKKRYRYRLSMPPVGNVFERKYITPVDRILRVDLMEIAAKALIGSHDFRAFTTMKSKKKSTIRQIYAIRFFQPSPQELWIDFSGDGFLRQQVRIMTGLLIQVGMERIEPDQTAGILLKKSRDNTRMIAPAKGLCLEEVNY
jgi:tRNA pseudouridine38-40 synthase